MTIDVRDHLGAFCAAIQAHDWDKARRFLADDVSWYAGKDHSGPDEVIALLKLVAENGFDRPGAETDEAEILVGEHHHGMFWAFKATVGSEQVWNFEIWLAELDGDGRIRAVFTFAEDTGVSRRFWA